MSGPPGQLFIETRHRDIYASTDPTKTDLSQPGKVVLITGAGRGIGRSTALRFAECGVEAIILCARTTSQLDEVEQSIKSINPSIRVHKLPVDVSDEAAVRKLAETVLKAEGKLNVLINNAGMSTDWVNIAESKVDDYWRCWEVNYKGPYLMTRYFLPLLLETAKEGTRSDIINVSSIGAEVLVPGASSYQVNKLALNRFTEFTQLEYGSQGINCVAIHPGGVLTELSKENKQIRDFLVDTPELAAGFMVWLTKGQRTWLGGRFLYANWDVDKLELKRDDIVSRDLLKARVAV